MQRLVSMAVLVPALATSVAACGGASNAPPSYGDGPTSTAPAAPATAQPAPPAPHAQDDVASDEVVELQAMRDGVQTAADAVLGPIKGADALLDSIAKLPDELRSAGSKADPRRVMAELKKILAGKDAALDALDLEGDAKAKVLERARGLKALVTSVMSLDVAVNDLATKLADAAPKIERLGRHAIAKAELTLKNPLAGGDAKKLAEADKAKITAIIDGFKTKAAGWQQDLRELPAKVKELPAKFGAAFR